MVLIMFLLRLRVVTLEILHTIDSDGGGLIMLLIALEETKARRRRFGAHPDG
jgi:hypothetical protein